MNLAAYKWSRVDLAKQKDEKIAMLKRELSALSQYNNELVSLLQRHAMECPRLSAALNNPQFDRCDREQADL